MGTNKKANKLPKKKKGHDRKAPEHPMHAVGKESKGSQDWRLGWCPCESGSQERQPGLQSPPNPILIGTKLTDLIHRGSIPELIAPKGFEAMSWFQTPQHLSKCTEEPFPKGARNTPLAKKGPRPMWS